MLNVYGKNKLLSLSHCKIQYISFKIYLEPASFVDNNNINTSSNSSTSILKYENSIYLKSVNENQDFKLECLAKGRPKPTITWFLKYSNGSSFSKLLLSKSLEKNFILIKNFIYFKNLILITMNS